MADLVHYTKDTIFPGAFITCGGGPVIFASRRAQGSETKGTAPPLSSLTQRREQADKAADVRHERQVREREEQERWAFLDKYARDWF